MKQFYIIAAPAYFKRTMGWNFSLTEIEYRYTEDKLVIFVSCPNIPDYGDVRPYHTGWRDTEVDNGITLEAVYKPYSIDKE